MSHTRVLVTIVGGRYPISSSSADSYGARMLSPQTVFRVIFKYPPAKINKTISVRGTEGAVETIRKVLDDEGSIDGVKIDGKDLAPELVRELTETAKKLKIK